MRRDELLFAAHQVAGCGGISTEAPILESVKLASLVVGGIDRTSG